MGMGMRDWVRAEGSEGSEGSEGTQCGGDAEHEMWFPFLTLVFATFATHLAGTVCPLSSPRVVCAGMPLCTGPTASPVLLRCAARRGVAG